MAGPHLRATVQPLVGAARRRARVNRPRTFPAELLLTAYGVLTRARSGGGGAAASRCCYKVLTAFEDAGRCQRGYFRRSWVAQFAVASDRRPLRSYPGVDPERREYHAWCSPRPIRQPVRGRAAVGRPERWQTRTCRPPGRKAGRWWVVDGELRVPRTGWALAAQLHRRRRGTHRCGVGAEPIWSAAARWFAAGRKVNGVPVLEPGAEGRGPPCRMR